MLPSGSSFDKVTCVVPISFQVGVGKANVEA